MLAAGGQHESQGTDQIARTVRRSGRGEPAQSVLAQGPAARETARLSVKQEAHLVDLHIAGEHTIGELAELFSVGRSTVYRAFERAQRKTVSAPGS
ncbi:helix-turn-helix domain-containing protein [Pseudarthrobacter sp. N5]|uniref:helix-turn-helix domain-containing protein n=1 Tax=Pseudarthrobacter sp. N5 TaxID=3418416 RepID=UPI003CE85D4E